MVSFVEQLPAHLEATYGVSVKKMAPLEPWGPEGAQRVDLESGESWVARPHPPARPFEEVVGDAELLRFLEAHDFPAERLAHAEPVSRYGTGSVIITTLLPGKNCRGDNSPATINGIGRMLGLLHTLPSDEGAASRPAGGWHHLSQAGGGRDEDVRILLPLLERAAERLPDSEQAAYKELVVELESIDLCDDLPHCLINVDFGGPNIMKWRNKLTAIDWTGAGRGPRVHSMATLGWGASRPALLDAFVAGYREHAQLEPEEIDRLDGALVLHGLILNAWGVAFRGGMPSDVLEWLGRERVGAKRAAELTRAAFAKKSLANWEEAAKQAPPEPQQDPLQILINAVNGKTDDEVARFARQVGGFSNLCALVFAGLRDRLTPADCNVAFVLDDTMGWVLRAKDGKLSLTKRVAKRAPAIVRTSATDFLRIITWDLDWDTAVAHGRAHVEGDPKQVDILFAGRQAPPTA
jgi:Ser/Thr protein kinase RdoA (MazF antagonist)